MLIIFLVLVKPSSVARETELWPGPARGISELSSCLGPPGHHYPLNINLNPLEHMFYHFLDLRERFVLKILSLIILLVIYTVTTFIKVHCFLCVWLHFFFFFFFAKIKNELWKWYFGFVSAPPAPPQSKIVDMPLTEGSQRALYGSSLPLWASPGWCSSCTPSKMGCRPWRRGQAASQWHSPTMGTHTRCCTLEECIWWEKRQRYPGQTSRYILVLLVRNESLAITVED